MVLASKPPAEDVDVAFEQITAISEALEVVGSGPAQVKVALLSGFVWFCTGQQLFFISSTALATSQDFAASDLERGIISASFVAGILVGNSFGGLGDIYGRKLPICIGLGGVAIFSGLSTVTINIMSLIAARFATGACIGFGQPLALSIITEMTSTSRRLLMTTCSIAMWEIGALSAVLLLALDSPNLSATLNWKLMFQAGSVTATVFVLFVQLYLPESPRYLVSVGLPVEAVAVVESLCVDNGLPVPSCISQMPLTANQRRHSLTQTTLRAQGNSVRSLALVFGAEYLSTTVIMMLTLGVLNYVAYGFLFAFPLVLGEMAFAGPAVMHLAISLSVGLVVKFPFMIYGHVVSRVRCLQLFMVFQGVAVLLFALRTQMYLGYYSLKVAQVSCWSMVFIYLAEVYPTEARATGTSAAFTSGRVMAVSAPIIFEVLRSSDESADMFFISMVVGSWGCCALLQGLPFETCGEPLVDKPEVSRRSSSITSIGNLNVMMETKDGGVAYGACSSTSDPQRSKSM